MDAERWQKIKSLFDAAQELAPAKRERFLDNACAGDADLRREVEKLFASFENTKSFIESPAVGEMANLLEDKETLIGQNTTGELNTGKFVAGTVLANRYRIISLLGKGGMGEVFKAEDIKLNQTVALKFLPDKLEKDKSALDRFHAEVRNARRRWANLIISWNRLLAGDFSDPLVGRDILVGGILGLAHTFLIYLINLLPHWIGITAAPNPGLNVSYLQSFKHLWANFLMSPLSGIFLAFALLLFLVLLVTIFRKQWLATAVLWTLYVLILGLAFASRGHWTRWLSVALIATIIVVCISRFGLLAMVSFVVFFELSFYNAISANFSSWYFGNTIFAAVVILGLAIYGFWTSLAGQKIFGGKLFGNDFNV